MRIPNLTLHRECFQDCRNIPKADFILCSHVLPYVPSSEWLAFAEKLYAHLEPGGQALVVLQSPLSDCMKMLRSFCGPRRYLKDLVGDLKAKGAWVLETQTLKSRITTPSFERLFGIAEFIFNSNRGSDLPTRRRLVDYLSTHISRDRFGDLAMSCDQDLLLIKKEAEDS